MPEPDKQAELAHPSRIGNRRCSIPDRHLRRTSSRRPACGSTLDRLHDVVQTAMG
jgi:hypothetical protein